MSKNFTLKKVDRGNTVDTITANTLPSSKAVARQYDKNIRGKQGGDVPVAKLHSPRGGKGMECLGGNCS